MKIQEIQITKTLPQIPSLAAMLGYTPVVYRNYIHSGSKVPSMPKTCDTCGETKPRIEFDYERLVSTGEIRVGHRKTTCMQCEESK
jgi:hypothetical protein